MTQIVKEPLIHEQLTFLHNTIGVYPDWPKPGVVFRDIAPLFSTPEALKVMSEMFLSHYRHIAFDKIACIDARGFLIASIIAYELDKPLLLVRKKGKLPGETINQSYDLEYGSQSLEIQTSSCHKGERVVLLDDLIATGGSLGAAIDLVEKLEAKVVSAGAIIDLPGLGGSDLIRQRGIETFTLLSY